MFEYIAFLKKIILLPHKRVNSTLKYLIVHTRRVSFPNAGAWLPTPVVKKATKNTKNMVTVCKKMTFFGNLTQSLLKLNLSS